MNTIQNVCTIFAISAALGVNAALAQSSAQPTFPSAAEATRNLFEAVQHNDVDAIARILGGPAELASTGDEKDKQDREAFVRKYQEMHRVGRDPDGSATLYIGPENWPFPIPLVQTNGSGRFDADAGRKEVLYRRIGENELSAIEICQALAKPGQQDAELAATISNAPNQTNGVMMHGYYFRALPESKTGKIYIAYPVEYRSSGVMTFIVGPKGVVYEKDLGQNSPKTAASITSFHKDGTWRVAPNAK